MKQPSVPRELTLRSIQRSFEEINRKIAFIDESGNINLHGRRFVNAGRAVLPSDFVTKAQVEGVAEQVAELLLPADSTAPTLTGATLTVEATGPFVAVLTVTAPTDKPTGWSNVTKIELQIYDDPGLDPGDLVYSDYLLGSNLRRVIFTHVIDTDGATFYARFRATNEIGLSNWSSPAVQYSLSGIGGLGVDDDVPNGPQIAVVAELLGNGSVRYTFGAEIPTTNAKTVYATRFQIARDSGFTDVVFDDEGGSPDNLIWVTSEITTFYFRACACNCVGWGAWSSVITKQSTDIVEGPDTGVPGQPQNVQLVSDDTDASVPGNELVVTFDRPATNFNTLFAYAVQIHNKATFPGHAVVYSGTGSCNRGGFVLTDSTKNFQNVVGKNLWVHSGSPPTEANLVSTGEIISATATTVTIDDPIRYGGSAVYYQILVGDWTQVVRSVDLPTKLLDPTVQDDKRFRVVLRGLPQDNYYARVKGANRYGLGSWSSVVGPVSLDGLKGDDIKDGEIDRSLFITGLEPIQIVDSLPGSATQGQIVFLTTDNKLYRYTGSAWTKAVDGGDITANTVVTDALTAGCVTSAKMSVSQLDSISANVGTLTAGSIIGLTHKTSASGARVEMTPSGLFGYSASAEIFSISNGSISATSMSIDSAWTPEVNSSGNISLKAGTSSSVYLMTSGTTRCQVSDTGIGVTGDIAATGDIYTTGSGEGIGVAADGFYRVGSNQVVGPQGAAVADASGGSTVDVQARDAINALLARCRAHGLIAT